MSVYKGQSNQLSECIGAVIYEAMTPECGRSVVQVLVVRVDIGNGDR